MQAEQNIAIGELSRRTGVNIETIRYFERVGILAKPPRTSAGRRIYGADHIRTLGLVRRARELGFTQAEVRAILSIWDPSEPGCSGTSRSVIWSTFDRRWWTWGSSNDFSRPRSPDAKATVRRAALLLTCLISQDHEPTGAPKPLPRRVWIPQSRSRWQGRS